MGVGGEKEKKKKKKRNLLPISSYSTHFVRVWILILFIYKKPFFILAKREPITVTLQLYNNLKKHEFEKKIISVFL